MKFGDPRLPQRFWYKVQPCPMSGCWIWTGATLSKGYGTVRIGDAVHKAHRVAFVALAGPIPDGAHLDHRCRVRCCVNPAHLEPVSPLENQRRGLRGELTTHCPKGHPYAGRNLMRNHRSRLCRACIYESNRRSRTGLRPLTGEQVAEVNKLLESA